MIEIDSVCRKLEWPVTEAGDYISDEYLLAVELSTAPHISHANVQRIASSIRRLNRSLATTSVYLVDTDLAEVYDDVVSQLNAMNSGLEVGTLAPLIRDESRFQDYSPSFKFAAQLP